MKIKKIMIAICIAICYVFIAKADTQATAVWLSGQFNDAASAHNEYSVKLNGNDIDDDGNIVISQSATTGVTISLSDKNLTKVSLLVKYELPSGGAPTANSVIVGAMNSGNIPYGALCVSQEGTGIEGYWLSGATIKTGYPFGSASVSGGEGYMLLSCNSPQNNNNYNGTSFYSGQTLEAQNGGEAAILRFSNQTITMLSVGGPVTAHASPWKGMVIKSIALFADERFAASDVTDYEFPAETEAPSTSDTEDPVTPPEIQIPVGVVNVTCQQQYPWNGKVDIDYEVVAEDPDADVWVYVVGFDKDSNQSMGVWAISGDGANASVKPGVHRMTWDVTADYPGFNSSAFTVKMTAVTGGAPYMVVDLSGGVDALTYPVSYLSSVPAGGWSDEYKTTKLVLRLIPPGTFMMGSPTDELGRQAWWVSSIGLDGMADELLHSVRLTKPFYIGVFEITQNQWQLVMGDTPSNRKGAMRPVENVSYTTIRGSVNGVAWPTHNQVDANSFMGRLRSKVNMLFDLPTEAQWEYACRAGTSTAVNSGKDATDANMAEVGRYNNNRTDGKGGYTDLHTKVGSYLPNAWGLYDMHGNVYEFCLDCNSQYPSNEVTDPKGASSGGRIIRGGSADRSARVCRSAQRAKVSDVYNSYGEVGLRVVCLPAAE